MYNVVEVFYMYLAWSWLTSVRKCWFNKRKNLVAMTEKMCIINTTHNRISNLNIVNYRHLTHI